MRDGRDEQTPGINGEEEMNNSPGELMRNYRRNNEARGWFNNRRSVAFALVSTQHKQRPVNRCEAQPSSRLTSCEPRLCCGCTALATEKDERGEI
uniref:Uncharacterized protein n=1 Tax=Vespula pensylvanica TaxID=30213 RepID=A0A834UCS1_VESPE|nr:hypothetical protein H0235_004297 [Vespula pensylvanica]